MNYILFVIIVYSLCSAVYATKYGISCSQGQQVLSSDFKSNLPPVLEKCKNPLEKIKNLPLGTKGNLYDTNNASFTTYGLDKYFPDNLTGNDVEKKKECIDMYKKSINELEGIIINVSFQHPSVKSFSESISNRLFDLLKTEAELKTNDNIKQKEILDSLLVDHVGGKKFYDPEKVKLFPGSVGDDPKTIMEMFKEGNPRERLQSIFTASYSFLTPLFKNPQKMKEFNERLISKGWQLNDEWVDNEHPLSNYGVYAQMNKSTSGEVRVSRSKEKQVGVKCNIRSYDAVPPSPRETAIIGIDRNTSKMDCGRKVWEIVTTNNPYSQEASSLHVPQVAGPSGNTDQLLTTALFLGLDEPKDLYAATLAAIGWIAGGDHHSVYEVLTATRSFHKIQLFKGGPNYYESIYPSELDPQFLQKIKDALNEKGLQLPVEYLGKKCLNRNPK